MTPHKRARLSSSNTGDPPSLGSVAPPALTSYSSSLDAPSQPATASSSFRNVSACNRCRVRKNRCDQNLPACSSCERVGVKCTGFDPITKREIPRTYVYYLESRVSYLEDLLTAHGIGYGAPQEFDLGAKPIEHHPHNRYSDNATTRATREVRTSLPNVDVGDKQNESEKLDKLVSNIGLVSVQGTSDPRFLGSTSGISFARVVFAAVKSSLPSGTSGRKGSERGKLGANAPSTNAPSMRGRCCSDCRERRADTDSLILNPPHQTPFSDFRPSQRYIRRLSQLRLLGDAWSIFTLSMRTHKYPSCTEASSRRCFRELTHRMRNRPANFTY